MTICDKINTAGNTLQSKLNERGVSCTYGKNSDNKQTITDMANLITSDNLKGANDAILNIYANRPYLMDGETTDIIATLHDGLGNPLVNKEITITADIEDEVMDNIFTSSTWNNNIYNSQEGILNNSSSYTYMTKEFTGLNNYTLSFMLNSLESGAELRFGDTISGTASNYLKFKFANSIMTISKVVNNVETTVYTYTFGQQAFIQFMSSTQTITRSGDTFTFFGQTITMSGLKNTIGLVGTIGFYENDFTVAPLYTGITNNDGTFQISNQTINSDTPFTSSYGTQNNTTTVENVYYINYMTSTSHKEDIVVSTGSLLFEDDGAIFDATTYSSGNYQFTIRPNWVLIPVPFSVEFELVDCTSNNARVYFHNSLTSSAIASGSLYRENNAPTIVRFVVTSSAIKRYLGTNEATLSTNTSIGNNMAVRFGYLQPTQAQIKIRNYRIKQL